MSSIQDGGFRSGVSRRHVIQAAAAAVCLPAVRSASAQDKLAGSGEVVVHSYGGASSAGMRASVFEPFTKATGIKVIDVLSDYADPQVLAMSKAGKIDWDIAQINPIGYPAMHAAGTFVPIDYKLWDAESLQGVPQRARLEDAFVLYSTVTALAYDGRAFLRGGPKSWTDFWDVQKFPGARGLNAISAERNIPFALAADGVPFNQIWPLTDDKLDRAFRKLDQIKPHITKWWTGGGEPVQLLVNREYAMTSAYDGRLLTGIRQGAPIKFIWEGATLADSPFGMILKGGPNTANAQKLIAFLNRAPIAAAFTNATNNPAMNVNQFKYLPPDLVPLLNVNPQNTAKTIYEDWAWLAAKRPDGKSNIEHIRERWLKWRTA